MLDPTKSVDRLCWETGLNLLDAMDINLMAANEVLALTEGAVPPNPTDQVKNIVQSARRYLKRAEIANAAARHHYMVGSSHEPLIRNGYLQKELLEQARRLPDHLEGRAVRDNDPVEGRARLAFLVVESSRAIHEQGNGAINLAQEHNEPLDTLKMLQAITWQAILAVENTGSATRELTRLS